MAKIRVLEKKVEFEGKSFPVLKAIEIKKDGSEVWYDLNFKLECKDRLQKEMIKNDLNYPVELTINKDQHFIVTENKKGFKNEKIVVLDYETCSPVDLTAWKEQHPLTRRTLED